ncbi:MAG: hypothetical protein QXU24_04080 [Ignisphaera sp.]
MCIDNDVGGKAYMVYWSSLFGVQHVIDEDTRRAELCGKEIG